MIQNINNERGYSELKKLIKELLPKKYYITDLGKVLNSKGHVMFTCVVNSGYETIHCQGKHFTIHRLVAKYFCEGYKEGLVVDHINNDRLDNRATNLHWVTPDDNMRDVIERGRNDTATARKALKKRRNTPVYMLDKNTEKIIHKFSSIREASKATGTSEHEISSYLSHKPRRASNGKNYYMKSAGGYKWKLVNPNHDNGMTRIPITLVNKETGRSYTFPSMNQASKFLGRNSSTVTNWVKRGYKEHDGYKLIY